MPIHGMTDQAPQFPRIGVLRKGAEKAANGPGADLKYFRFTDADEQASATFKSIYGEMPAQIRVLLPYSTPEANFHAWMEEYSASSLIRRCDGETQVLVRAGARYDQTPRPCMRAQGKECNCKQSGRLFVIIPELKRAGFVVALTTSKHDIINLSAQLQAAQAIVGDLAFRVPFILSRKPVKISTPAANNKRARREKWLLSIEIAPSFVQAQLSAMQRDALLQLNAPASVIDQFVDEPDEDEEDMTTSPAPVISIDEARKRFVDATNTAMQTVSQLSQASHEEKAGALDKAINANRVNVKDATVAQLIGAADAIAQATRDALEADGEAQAEALAGADNDVPQFDPAPAPSAPAESQPASVPTPAPVETLAAQLHRQFVELVAKRAGQKASDKQRQMAFLALQDACGEDKGSFKRHTIQAHIFGVEKFDQLNDAQVLAAIDWLKPYLNGDKKYHTNQATVKEIEQVLSEALANAGQQQLPLG